MLLRNYFIFSDDKIIGFFIVSRSFPLKSQRFCQIIPIVQIICLFTFCSLRNHFQTIRENFLIEIYLQCMYSINSYRIFFLPYPQNMRCLMKFRRTFDLLLLLMLHYVFCFKIKILYHSEFSRFFLPIFYKNMHIGEIYYVLQHSTDYR